jgi:hypothetical protein
MRRDVSKSSLGTLQTDNLIRHQCSLIGPMCQVTASFQRRDFCRVAVSGAAVAMARLVQGAHRAMEIFLKAVTGDAPFHGFMPRNLHASRCTARSRDARRVLAMHGAFSRCTARSRDVRLVSHCTTCFRDVRRSRVTYGAWRLAGGDAVRFARGNESCVANFRQPGVCYGRWDSCAGVSATRSARGVWVRGQRLEAGRRLAGRSAGVF